MAQRLTLLRELEFLIIVEAVEYRRGCFDSAYPADFDADHFDIFLTDLYESFTFDSYEYVRNLDDNEKLRYLELSYNEFINLIPEDRVSRFYKEYWRIYCKETTPKSEIDSENKRFLSYPLRAYKKHFSKYLYIAHKMYHDFNNGKFDPVEHIFGDLEPIKKHEHSDVIIIPSEENKNTIETINPQPATNHYHIDNPVNKIQDLINSIDPSDEELNLYLDDWLSLRVTLSQWHRNRNINIIDHFRHLNISEELIDEMHDHQSDLYHECVYNLVNSFIERFEKLQFQIDKIEIGKRELALINDLIGDNLDSNKVDKLTNIFSRHNWNDMVVHFEYILRQTFYSYNNHDIHHKDSFLYPEAIYKYRNYLIKFLDNTNKPTHPILIPPLEPKVLTVAFKYTKLSANISRLTELFNTLKKQRYISDETDIKDFRKIFSQVLPDKQIKWIGTLEEITYFVKLLHRDYKVIDEIPKTIWKVTANLFVDEHGSPYDWKKFRGQKTPARAAQLEKAVEKLV